jgi:hypothetical protein
VNKRFNLAGSVEDSKRLGRPRTGRSEQNTFELAQKIMQSPRKSVRQMAVETGIPKSSVNRILTKDLKFRSYIPRLKQELFAEDCDQSMEFCEKWLETTANDPTFSEHVLWSDEAIFRLNGHITRHNCTYWSDAIPHLTID